MNSTWLITSELANQRARKVLFTCVVYTIFREEALEASTVFFYADPLSWSNRNLDILVFVEGGKPESPEENPWSEVTINNKLNPHTLSGRNRTRKQHSWETSTLTTALSLLAILNKNGVLQHG